MIEICHSLWPEAGTKPLVRWPWTESRVLLSVVALLSLPPVQAHAQITPIASGLPEGANNYGFSLSPGYERPLTAQDMREQEIEHKYKETLKKIPNKKPVNDPWAGVRAAPVADRHRPM
jgi:hypothetical protein